MGGRGRNALKADIHLKALQTRNRVPQICVMCANGAPAVHQDRTGIDHNQQSFAVASASGISSRRRDIGFRKIIALEQQREVAVFRERIGCAVAQIEGGPVAASAIA